MNELLQQYKHLVDFEDKMQKSNMKFVESYLSFQARKKCDGWEQDCIEFLEGAINLQQSFLSNLNQFKARFN